MEDVLNYEKRDQLYDFLIKDFGFKKVNEAYDDEAFGNFYIILSSRHFDITYMNDRDFLDIWIASKEYPEQVCSLSFVRDLVYNPDRIVGYEDDGKNAKRIKKLNAFLKKDFNKICELFSPEKYHDTKKRLEEGIIKQLGIRVKGYIQE